jgi:spore coat protein CotH
MDRICIVAVVAAVLISVLFMNGASFGIQTSANAMAYETRLFDTGKVHTIDILIDDWDAFLQTARNEEYSVCSVVIDGEAFKNVGIRGKGNTSLTQVASMGSDRYSFKIEFDQYDSTKSYYGLDKISLNNLIQDNTMMKDYLTYQMMNEFAVAAPLCSYAYLTVNGEDWGLYLAVEAVEESFLQRNYGADHGDLYKPDKMNMGGGRGNGKDFDPENLAGADREQTTDRNTRPGKPDRNQGMMPGQRPQQGAQPSVPTNGNFGFQGGMMPGNMGGEGSSETKLQYIDDEPSSYSAIFSSAKTDVTTADQTRLIAALKALSEGKDSAVDTEAVIRYFVVHNFVVNADSYTGSMIHNYYLYEKDGRLAMIPWDYNLAFGTFQSNNANAAVNDDIDAPLSVTGNNLPMIDWIFDSEEYTRLYHQYFQEFLERVDMASIIAQAKELIAPYVEKDPTKFCTYEEFEKGAATLEAFCDLRYQSVAQQLDGNAANVDASSLTLSDMGTMSHGSGGQSGSKGQRPNAQAPEESRSDGFIQLSNTNEPPTGGQQFPGFGGQGGMTPPEGMENMRPGQNSGNIPQQQPSKNPAESQNSPWFLLTVTLVILAAGLVFAFRFKR